MKTLTSLRIRACANAQTGLSLHFWINSWHWSNCTKLGTALGKLDKLMQLNVQLSLTGKCLEFADFSCMMSVNMKLQGPG